jgi:Plasma-membrane choline transporter
MTVQRSCRACQPIRSRCVPRVLIDFTSSSKNEKSISNTNIPTFHTNTRPSASLVVTMSSPYYNAGSSIPIVQGHVVSATGGGESYQHHANVPQGNYNAHAEDVSSAFHGEPQPSQCKDGLWAVLFYAHLGVMAFVAIRYAPMMAQDYAADYAGGAYRKLSEVWRGLEEEEEADAYDNNDGNGADESAADFDISLASLVTIIALTGLAALLVSSAAIALMMSCPKPLIKMALFFNLFLTGAMAVTSLLSGAIPAAVMMGLLFMVNVCYIRAVWSRIPFAASNLITAITAVKSNMGLAFFAYNNLLLTFFWSIWWSIAFVATTYVVSNCNAQAVCENEMNGGLIFLFLVSFFWTAQVVKNVVHVTVAGTVGTWWLFPHEANGCCSQAVRDSYWRSVTTSFGSICLGSLIVALIQATREIVNSMRNQDDSLLLCIADCLLGCLEQLAEYFNKVSFFERKCGLCCYQRGESQ